MLYEQCGYISSAYWIIQLHYTNKCIAFEMGAFVTNGKVLFFRVRTCSSIHSNKKI